MKFGEFISTLFNDPYKPSEAPILFLGDSNTADYPNNWTGFLRSDLRLKNAKIIQKNGETTDWMKDQLSQDLAKGNRYNYVFIWGGINDIYTTGTVKGKDRALQNIKDMVSMLRKTVGSDGLQPKIILINIGCDNLRSERYDVNEKLSTQLYNQINYITNVYKVIPTRSILSLNGLPCSSFSSKQITQGRKDFCRIDDPLCHLNESANRLLANYIKKAVFKKRV